MNHRLSLIILSHFSSTVIDHVKKSIDADCALVFFYFDFRNGNKQHADTLLLSFVSQLCHRIEGRVPTAVLSAFEGNSNGAHKPSIPELIVMLSELSRCYKRLYVVVDALDECSQWHILSPHFLSFCQDNDDLVHLLVTSRGRPDIEHTMDSLQAILVTLGGDGVDVDIRSYVEYVVDHEPSLKKWGVEGIELITKTLSAGAGGM
jgi:hypothetical protein